MESVARLSSAERRELFAETAARKGMTPAVVEKDFWVCWTLGKQVGCVPRTKPGQAQAGEASSRLAVFDVSPPHGARKIPSGLGRAFCGERE